MSSSFRGRRSHFYYCASIIQGRSLFYYFTSIIQGRSLFYYCTSIIQRRSHLIVSGIKQIAFLFFITVTVYVFNLKFISNFIKKS